MSLIRDRGGIDGDSDSSVNIVVVVMMTTTTTTIGKHLLLPLRLLVLFGVALAHKETYTGALLLFMLLFMLVVLLQ